MININRRNLLHTTALIPVALLVNACTPSQQATVSQVSADLSTIADGVTAVLPAISVIKGVSANVVSKIGVAVSVLKSIASSAAGSASTVSVSAINNVENVVSGMLNAVSSLDASGVKLPSNISSIFQAVSALWPVVETGLGIVTSIVPMSGPKAEMSPEQARLILKGAK